MHHEALIRSFLEARLAYNANLVASRHRGPERAIVKREEFEEAYWTAFGRPYTMPQALTPEADVASARRSFTY